jgi:tRNA (cytidine56-2'-O)-methyltransferase
VARAFGAERLYLNPPDPELARRVSEVSARFGGSFEVEGTENWKSVVRQFDGVVVHLTMYGLPMERFLPRLRGVRSILLVVGGAKVPNELYRLATHNLAVGHQPHSEVGALAVVLSSLRGTPGPGAWPGARQAIVPRARGKMVRLVKDASP